MKKHRFMPALLPLLLWIGVAPVWAGGQEDHPVAEESPMVEEAPVGEILTYRWELRGALSFLAGLFLPDSGRGILRTESVPGGMTRSQLRIESEQSAAGEFWLYGAEIRPTDGETEEVWSAYKWRDKESSKRERLDGKGMIDVVSGIYGLRLDPPQRPRRLEIWSDGKMYPVVIFPGHSRTINVCGDRTTVRPYSIRGIDLPDRRHWKGRLEIWLADDPQATPVRIVVDRGWAKVRLDLREAREDGSHRVVCGTGRALNGR